MLGYVATCVATQVMAAHQEAEDFRRVLALAPESMRQGLIDRRAEAFKADQNELCRRELVEAAKPKEDGIGPLHILAFMFGVAIS